MPTRPNIEESRRMLVEAVETVRSREAVDKTLLELQEQGQRWWERDDIIWFEIVLSLATQGGSYGSRLVINDEGEIDQHRYGSVAFRTLEQVDPNRRSTYLESRLYGTVRMQSMKAEALEQNFEMIKEEYGDPRGAKEAFIDKNGPEAKIEFLKQFKRIGDKYARNIPMDLYLNEFREFIAIDSRIKGIMKEAGYPVGERGYAECEEFLRSVASESNMEPWELDRTLYNFEDDIDTALSEICQSTRE